MGRITETTGTALEGNRESLQYLGSYSRQRGRPVVIASLYDPLVVVHIDFVD